MSRKGWLGIAVVALVGCGGQVTGPEPFPPPIDVVDDTDRKDEIDQQDHRDDARREPGKRSHDLRGHDRTSHDSTTPPTPPKEDPPTPVPPKPTPTPWPSASCLTIVVGSADVHLATLSFASGLKRDDNGAVLDLDAVAARTITSIGRQGDALVACSLGHAIRIAIEDGAVETSTISCDAITADADAIWVQSSARGALERYADWSAVTSGTPDKTFEPIGASRIGVNSGVVIGALDGHDATISIVRFDSATGERTTSKPIGVSGPANRGIDLASNGYVFLTYQSTMFAIYNPASGGMTAAGTVSSSSDGFRGVVCD